MKKVLEDFSKCTGCSLCGEVCPKRCITMTENFEGFKYPKINQELCIDCRICNQNCPVNQIHESKKPVEVYAFRHNDDVFLSKSASGGVASCLAEYCLDVGGGVTGVKLDSSLRAVHDLCLDKLDLDKFRDSKYVQSDLSGIFKKIEDNLKDGKLVLVTGVPCQIAAIKQYLKKDYENLVLCDLICHGFPSPKVFNSYIEQLEKNNNKKIEKFYFRDKTNGWDKSNIRVVYKDGAEQIITRQNSDFFKVFNISLRRSCYQCQFREFRSGSDITIGDFWGIERKTDLYKDNKGCSIVLIKSQKGKDLFEKIKKQGKIFEVDLPFAIETHPKLVKSLSSPRTRTIFFNDLNKFGLSKATRLYTNNTLQNRIRKIIKLCFERRKK